MMRITTPYADVAARSIQQYGHRAHQTRYRLHVFCGDRGIGAAISSCSGSISREALIDVIAPSRLFSRINRQLLERIS
jgi:hypothetical protein